MAYASMEEGKAPTLRHQVMQNPNFDTEYPELAGEKIREQLQSQITERSPYNREDVQREWLEKYQQGESKQLQSLISQRDALQGNKNTLGKVEATRDVTKGLRYNPQTLKNVKAVQAEAEERNNGLRELLDADLNLTPEARKAGWDQQRVLRAYNKNDGIIRQANSFQKIWDEETWWGGYGKTEELNRRNVEGAGPAARQYQTYQDRDKNQQSRELENMNLGRRQLYERLLELQSGGSKKPTSRSTRDRGVMPRHAQTDT